MHDVYLARHGETDYNAEPRFQGQLPVPLNARGRAQAAELAERAAAVGFAVMWASPLRRARETAAIVGARIGLSSHEDARLMETDAGAWTDRSFAEVQADDPQRFAAFIAGDPDFAFPGGESFAEQADRVMAALAEIDTGPKPALVVCHGVVIRLAIARLGADAAPGRLAVPNAALIELRPDGAVLPSSAPGAATPPS